MSFLKKRGSLLVMKKTVLIAILILVSSCSSVAPKRDFTLIAHRGASGYLPEHTLEAVTLAHSFDVDFIEPDVVLTKDNVPVILHDIHLDTTTNVNKLYPQRVRKDGRFYAIDFTLREIKRLSVHERVNLKSGKLEFPNRFPLNHSSFKVPTLKEYLELVAGLNKTRKKDIGIYLEIKSPKFHLSYGKDITVKVLKLLKRYGYYSRNHHLFIQCFDSRTLKRIRLKLKKDIKLTQLIAENSWNESDLDYDQMRTENGLKEISIYADGVGPWLNHLVSPTTSGYTRTKLVENAHKHGLKVHPYTHRIDSYPSFFANHNQMLSFLINDLNIDGIFSDFPDTVKSHLKTR